MDQGQVKLPEFLEHQLVFSYLGNFLKFLKIQKFPYGNAQETGLEQKLKSVNRHPVSMAEKHECQCEKNDQKATPMMEDKAKKEVDIYRDTPVRLLGKFYIVYYDVA